MKLFLRISTLKVLLIISTSLIIGCSQTSQPVNIETSFDGANIFGAVFNDNGSPARGMAVYLIPSDFDPHAAGFSENIDSTKTDASGHYAFNLDVSGFYNVTARDNGKYYFADSVYGSAAGSIRVVDGTLETPGSISGVVKLRPGDDPQDVVILALGTHTYSIPSDSSGAFSLPNLAQGEYRLRFLTSTAGYGVFDTIIIVKSGEVSPIGGVVRLPYEGIPGIGAVTARLDSKLMYVRLSWNPVDTANVAALYIFRNTAVTRKPFAIIKNTDTMFEEDVLLLDPDRLAFGDTLRYSVAALGKDASLGDVSRAPDLMLTSTLFEPVDTVSLSSWDDNTIWTVKTDLHDNVYLRGHGWIARLDSTGHIAAHYSEADSTGYPYTIWDFFPDESGNVYALSEGRNIRSVQVLKKLSPDFKEIHSMPIEDLGNFETMNIRGAYNRETFYLLGGPTDQSDDNNYIAFLDSSLSFVKYDTFPGWNMWSLAAQVQNATFVTPVLPSCESRCNEGLLNTYDADLNPLGTINIGPFIEQCLPDMVQYFRTEAYSSEDGRLLLAFSINDSQSIVVSIDPAGNPEGRCKFTYNLYHQNLAFNGIDKFSRLSGKGAEKALYTYKLN